MSSNTKNVLGRGLRAAIVLIWLPLSFACHERTASLFSSDDEGGGDSEDAGLPDRPQIPIEEDTGLPPEGDASPPPVDTRVRLDACVLNPSDPANCGACGLVCSFPNALPLCQDSVCARGDCLPGFMDLDNLPATGCEYQCTPSNGGVEVCDGKDNNCDGATDEGTDFGQDLNNCGGCGLRCAFLNAAATCSNRVCVPGACAAGFADANGVAADGCECAQTNAGAEMCDGLDNDCNGKVDDVPGISMSEDPRHCGACNANCLGLANATGACVQGTCAIEACAFGHADVDNNPSNGCELACPGGFLGAAEVCDGVDNNCDGKVDSNDPNLVAVANFCQQKGECNGAAPVCQQGAWTCSYNSNVEMAASNQIVSNETRCDGKDNDCDGCIDESFPQVGLKPAAHGASCAVTAASACADANKGVCQGRGTFVCSPEGSGVVCQVNQPGAQPAAELCNAKDDNCDGIIDNASVQDPARVKDAMVAVSGGGLAASVYVDAYEASRPDAEAGSPGQSTARACSKVGAIPWVNVTPAQAAAACAAAGKRLCTEQEWQRACTTAAAPSCQWSFATACTTASATTCNVYERAATAGIMSSNGLPNCFADWGANGRIYNLTGNVREWTKPRAAGQNPLRGGSYDTVLEGSTCSFAFLSVGDDFRYENTGFRCCSDVAP